MIDPHEPEEDSVPAPPPPFERGLQILGGLALVPAAFWLLFAGIVFILRGVSDTEAGQQVIGTFVFGAALMVFGAMMVVTAFRWMAGRPKPGSKRQ